MDIRKIIHINRLIKAQRTGSPKTLCVQLGVSERTAHNYLRYMRKELKAPIKWIPIKTPIYTKTMANLNLNGNRIEKNNR